jgi:hypothetical protein
MYLNWQPPIPACNKLSTIFRVFQNVQFSEELIYWGNQESFYQADDSLRGGGHFGFQGGSNQANRINWGGYDDIIQCRLAVPAGGTAPTSGTFTLSHAGQTTAAIARNATAATIKTALETLSNIPVGSIVVTGGPLPTFVDIVWTIQVGYGNALITINTDGLVGGTYSRDGASATARGSIPTLAYAPGNPVSPYYPWVPGEDYFMEVYRSPKQNWLASELTTDDQHPSANQHVNEVAWRLDVTRLSTGEKTFVRDLLYPQGKAASDGGSFYGLSSWAEDFNPTEVNWSCRWNEYRVDDRLVVSASVSYGSGLARPSTNVGLDKVGFKMQSRTTRLVAESTVLAQPGVAIRSWSSVATGSTFINPVSVAKPVGTLSGDRLLMACVVTGDRPGVTASGFTIVSEGPLSATADDARVVVFTKVAGPVEPSFYSINQGLGAPMAVGVFALYGADKIAKPVAGPINNITTPNTVWSAPQFDTKTNYPKVIYIAAGRPTAIGTNITVDGNSSSPVERIDTNVLTGDWDVIAMGEESSVRIAGTSSAKTGTGVSSRWQALQVFVPPLPQRVALASDLSNGTWTIAPLYNKLNELVPNDTSFISGPNGAVSKMGFGTFVSDPGTRIGYAIRFRARLQDGNSGSLTMKLFQNGTVLKATRVVEIPFGDIWKDFVVELTEAEANSITDLGALSIEQTATTS